MLQSYLRIAWRNLLKHKTFSVINILGLAIGIASCMIIFLYVHFELTFDQYNTKASRIARVTTTLHTPESDVLLATSPTPLADALKRDYPELESAARLENKNQVVKFKSEVFSEGSFYKADQSIFSIFDFAFTGGAADRALKDPNSIVITETIAKKYFGNGSPLGKTMVCNGVTLRVTGVIKNRPANSDIPIDALISAQFSKIKTWMDDLPVYTFILFYRKPDLKQFKNKIMALSRKYAQPELDATEANKYKAEFELEPLAAVHFSAGKLEDTAKGNKQFNYVFSLLAVFILIIAFLNYINLSTAKSTERAKEVGIRKVSGASRSQLMRQFLFESFVVLTISCLLAIGLVQAGLPLFNKLLQTQVSFRWQTGVLFTGAIFGITLVLAGVYPAFVLSAFKPVQVLKGNWRVTGRAVLFRKIVIVAQFAIASALIVGTVVLYNQMKFVEQKDLGFDKDQLLNISLPADSAYASAVSAFQDDLRQRPEIQDLTVGDGMTLGGATLGSTKLESDGKKRELMCIYYSIDPHFLPVFQIHLAEGRNLSDSFASDKKEAFLVNETFVKTMGWKSAIGKSIEGLGHNGRVVGVVKNFYFNSLHNLIDPLILVYNISASNNTTVKIKPRDLPTVKALFKKNLPDIPIDYSFIDEMVNKQYLKDRMTMSLFNCFTIGAIFVSCLGLYGLVALIAVQRTKEISIRKVLGASLSQLFSLMTKEFLALIGIALVISLPVAGFVMNNWLRSYAYHVQLQWSMFLIPVLLVLVFTLAVISKEIIKTAIANPVKNLRDY
jgi:putative ABC transport system permease protein